MNRRQFLIHTSQTALAATVLNPAGASAVAAEAESGSINYLTYPLRDGWVDNWLVAGRQAIVIPNVHYFYSKDADALRPPITREYYRQAPLVAPPFVEGAEFTVEGTPLAWRYHACGDDHLVDLAVWYGSARYVRSWAYAEIENEIARAVTLQLFTNGPADVWIGGRHIGRNETYHYKNLIKSEFAARLEAGTQPVLVRFEHIIPLGSPYGMALRLKDVASEAVQVRVPVRTADVARRQAIENAFQQVYPSRDSYLPGDDVSLVVPQLAVGAGIVNIELRQEKSVVRTAKWDTAQPATTIALGKAETLGAGRCSIALAAAANRREVFLHYYPHEFLTAPRPGSTWASRREEALKAIVRKTPPARDPNSKARVNLWQNIAVRGRSPKWNWACGRRWR